MQNSIDLFSGCGGMTLGFGWAGFNSVLASDIDENCEKTFYTNFPEVPFLCGDLSQFKKEDFDKQIQNKEVDIIIGGPPCQAYSIVGRSRRQEKELNPDDDRVFLYREYYRILAVHNPPVFIMENVKGLLSTIQK